MERPLATFESLSEPSTPLTSPSLNVVTTDPLNTVKLPPVPSSHTPTSPPHNHSHISPTTGLHPAWSHKAYPHMSATDEAEGVAGDNGPGHCHSDQGPARQHPSDGLIGPGSPPTKNLAFTRMATVSSSNPTIYHHGGPEGVYRRKVGFETFEPSTETALFSYTLQAKSAGYRRTRNTRVFQVAVSDDESGQEALDWLMESLIEDGDEVIAVRVQELDDGEKASPAAQEEFREEAAQLLKIVLEKNDEYDPDRRISVIVEFVAGKVTHTLMRLIALYRPDCE